MSTNNDSIVYFVPSSLQSNFKDKTQQSARISNIGRLSCSCFCLRLTWHPILFCYSPLFPLTWIFNLATWGLAHQLFTAVVKQVLDLSCLTLSFTTMVLIGINQHAPMSIVSVSTINMKDDLKSDHSKSGNIWKLDFLKVGFSNDQPLATAKAIVSTMQKLYHSKSRLEYAR